MKILARLSLVFLSVGLSVGLSADANAWGRRGHAAVAEVAAQILVERKVVGAEIAKDRAFDLGYFANVPDLIWKKPETYKQESTEHFMDMEIFERAVKTMPLTKALAMDRAEFTRTFPNLDIKAGRSFWRIREFMTKLDLIATELKKSDLLKEKRLELQNEWLIVAGSMAHYVGDLAQPLHVTENYDGQLTNQKGIHAYFEDVVVDEFDPGEVENAAYKKARSLKLSAAGKTSTELLQQLAVESNKSIAELLKIDKRIGRTDMKRAKAAYRAMIIDRIAAGSVYLAELWSRSLGWKYDSEKFFNFTPAPGFIIPGADRAIDAIQAK